MPTGLGVGLEYIKYTVKINMLYLIQKKKNVATDYKQYY